MCYRLSMRLRQATLNQSQKACWKRQISKSGLAFHRTDIDSILAELYEKGIAKPSAEQLVESEETIKKRYRFAKEKYGERMTFTGPDCGLGGWPKPRSSRTVA